MQWNLFARRIPALLGASANLAFKFFESQDFLADETKNKPLAKMYEWLLVACMEDRLRFTVFYNSSDIKIRERFLEEWLYEDELRVLKTLKYRINGRHSGCELLLESLKSVYGEESIKDPLLFKLYQSACELAM